MNGINYIHFVVEGMEGSFGQQRGSSEELRKMAEELFRLNSGSDIELTELVPILERYGMVEYLSFEQFSQYIAQTTHNALFQSAFKEDFNKYVSTHPSAQYHFPVIKDQRMTAFGRVTAIKFAKEYLLERTKIQTAKSEQVLYKCYEIYSQQRFKDEINNHKLTPSQTTVVPSQTTEVSGKSAQLQQGSIAKQAHVTQTTETEAPKLVPDFFYRRMQGSQRYSTKCLLSIDVTNLFEEELAQVKAIIEGQIEGNFFVFQSFQEFFKEYCFFDEIRKSEEFNEEDHLRLIDYYQKVYWAPRNKTVCILEDKESDLIQIWNKMEKRAKQTAEAKWEAVEHKVKPTLKQSLKNIHLSLILKSYRQQVHVVTALDILVINLITDITNLESYREKFLKPSMFVCIYHQMAHEFIRKIQSFDLIGLENPFSLEKQTFGSKLLKIILKNIQWIKASFQKTQITQLMESEKMINKPFRDASLVQNIVQNIRKIKKNSFNQWKQNQNYFKIQLADQLIDAIEKKMAIRFVENIMNKIIKSRDYFQMIIDEVNKFMENPKFSQPTQTLEVPTVLQQLPFAITAYIIYWQKSKDSYHQFTEKALKLRKYDSQGYFPTYKYILLDIFSLYDPSFLTGQQVKIFVSLFLSNSDPYEKMDKFLIKLDSVLDKSTSSKMKNRNRQYSQLRLNKLIEISKFLKFLKYSDMYQIAAKLPFFFNEFLESGFQIESKLFPCLQQSGKIYQKDFQLMKNIFIYRSKLIGKQPESKEERKNYIMFRNSNVVTNVVMDLSNFTCGLSKNRNMKR